MYFLHILISPGVSYTLNLFYPSFRGDNAMMEVAMVQAVFMEVLSWNRARINFLSNFIVALLKVKTVIPVYTGTQ